MIIHDFGARPPHRPLLQVLKSTWHILSIEPCAHRSPSDLKVGDAVTAEIPIDYMDDLGWKMHETWVENARIRASTHRKAAQKPFEAQKSADTHHPEEATETLRGTVLGFVGPPFLEA